MKVTFEVTSGTRRGCKLVCGKGVRVPGRLIPQNVSANVVDRRAVCRRGLLDVVIPAPRYHDGVARTCLDLRKSIGDLHRGGMREWEKREKEFEFHGCWVSREEKKSGAS